MNITLPLKNLKKKTEDTFLVLSFREIYLILYWQEVRDCIISQRFDHVAMGFFEIYVKIYVLYIRLFTTLFFYLVFQTFLEYRDYSLIARDTEKVIHPAEFIRTQCVDDLSK